MLIEKMERGSKASKDYFKSIKGSSRERYDHWVELGDGDVFDGYYVHQKNLSELSSYMSLALYDIIERDGNLAVFVRMSIEEKLYKTYTSAVASIQNLCFRCFDTVTFKGYKKMIKLKALYDEKYMKLYENGEIHELQH